MKRRVVAVKWVDSMRSPSWDSISDVIKSNRIPEEIITVGILIHETDDLIIVANSLDKQKYEDQVSMAKTIPRCSILKMITVKLPAKGWEL